MATKLTKKTSTPVKPIKKNLPASSKSAPQMASPKNYTYAVGRRRVATARVRLFKGSQDILVNGVPATDYWPSKEQQNRFMQPFILTKTEGQYTATVKIKGSGKMGQIGAFVHGVARALNQLDRDKYRPILKEHGLLNRDSRMKETRKVGRGGKARFKKQSPKR